MATVPKTRKPKASAPPVPLKLDLGAGQRPLDGYEGVDVKPGPGITHVVDLFAGTPWPFPDNSVGEIYSAHLVEHIPHYRPEYQGMDGWWAFFNEVHRICAPDATLRFIHPHNWSDRAFWDPTHTRYINETTWSYLNLEWRKLQLLDHYDARCDFELVTIAATSMEDGIAARNHEAQAFARRHYLNVLPDLIVDLRAIK